MVSLDNPEISEPSASGGWDYMHALPHLALIMILELYFMT